MDSLKTLKFLLLFFLVALPFFAFANAGSPIIWFNIFHLVIINAIIGLSESSILNSYKIGNKTIKIIIANYVSMLIGFYFIMPLFMRPEYGGDMWSVESSKIVWAFITSFLITLLIEYPFALWSLTNKKQQKVLFKPFLIANLATNIIMALIYWGFIAGSE